MQRPQRANAASLARAGEHHFVLDQFSTTVLVATPASTAAEAQPACWWTGQISQLYQHKQVDTRLTILDEVHLEGCFVGCCCVLLFFFWYHLKAPGDLLKIFFNVASVKEGC